MDKQAGSASIRGNRLALARRLGLLLLLTGALPAVNAQILQTPASEEQRRRSQAEALERQRRLQAPHVALPADDAVDGLTVPTESPCFTYHRIALEVPPRLSHAHQLAGASDLPFDPFRFAQDYLRQYEGVCIGQKGLDLILQRLTRLIEHKGYITTFIELPEQDRTSGTLKLVLVPGMIRAMRFTDPTLYGSWRNAFPTGPGQLLRRGDLEQGLEQMERIPSQTVEMHLVPAPTPGDHDVVLSVQRSTPWKLTANLDDSGARGTGKLQAGLNLAIDNPLGRSDLFNIGINTDADRQGAQRGTDGHNLYYAVPAGYWQYSVTASDYRYHQEIAGQYQSFVSSGKSKSLEFKVSQLFQRGPSQKNSWQLKVGKRWSRAYFNDIETEAHKRNTGFIELGWMHTHYFGSAQLDLTLSNRWGSSAFGGMGNPGWRAPEEPTFLYTLQSIDMSLLVPFRIAGQPVKYIGTLRGQNTRSPLWQTDQFAIGGRYTVRGFDGEFTLLGERGFYLRNELELPLANTAQAAYAGVDIGKVYGPSVQYLLGDKLAGATLGVRGRYRGFTYDLFSSWALSKPDHFKTATPALGFSLTYQY